MGQSSANGGKKTRWRKLCEQALTETSPNEMLELTEEVIRLVADEKAHKTDHGDSLIA